MCLCPAPPQDPASKRSARLSPLHSANLLAGNGGDHLRRVGDVLVKLEPSAMFQRFQIQLDEDIPYTAQMIATITRQQIGTVERALQIFLKLGLVEVLDSGTFYMSNIELLIGQSSTEAERKRAARLQNKALSAPRTNGGHLSDIRPPEIEIKL